MATSYIFIITGEYPGEEDNALAIQSVFTDEQEARAEATRLQSKSADRVYCVETWTTGKNSDCVAEWLAPR